MNYQAPLTMTLDVLGADRVLFAADYPFEQHGEAVAAIERMSLDAAMKSALFENNPTRVFRL
jgi:5-carboxyvanillate decarboxylase